jgi:ribulose-5-phosphate 4-epimerase/fuculose-1-phosphate aldolase
MVKMNSTDRAVADLVIANRILAHLGVFDEFGHISVRHPENPNRFLLARDRVAAYVEPGDIVELIWNGDPVSAEDRPLCAERFVHGAIYESRSDIRAVLYAASDEVATFTIAPVPFGAVIGPVGDMGLKAPVWDIADRFGSDTDLSVSTLERGRDLARCLGQNRVVLTRGVGFVATGRTLNDAVRMSAFVAKNARVLADSLAIGPIRRLSEGESRARRQFDPESNAMRRGWEYWARAAGCERWL